jgi:hypothetical protein
VACADSGRLVYVFLFLRQIPWADMKSFSRILVLVMFLAGCGQDASDPADVGVVDDMSSDVSVDQSMADAGSDFAESGDVADAGEEPACAEPSPTALPTGNPALEALASTPNKCGQPAYSWLNDPSLGDLVSEGASRTYTVESLAAIADTAGVELPVDLKYDVKVSVIEYVTQDRGVLATATALVAVPVPSAAQASDFQTLMFLHGTSGFTDGCGVTIDTESQLLGAIFASSGFVVVGPDYLGLKGRGEPTGFLHPYLSGQPVAISSLDAVRAVKKMGLFDQNGACVSDELLLFGGSQGGHAALWIDRLLPYYAPEFELLGAVATVPPADLLSAMKRSLTSPVKATANTAAFFSASAGWYGHAARLGEVLVSPYDVDLPAAMTESCDPSDSVNIDVQSLSDLFVPAFLASVDTLQDDPIWGCMAVENGLTTTSIARVDTSDRYAPTYEVMWVMGGDDQLVHTPIERDSFLTLCEQGMNSMIYVECAGASHTQATAQSLPAIMDFLHKRADRKPLPAQGLCELTAPIQCAP